MGLRREPSTAHYCRILRATAVDPPNHSSLVLTFRVLCHWGLREQWGRPGGEDAEGEGERSDGEGDTTSPLQVSLRQRLASELGGDPVFPSASGVWQSLDRLLFLVPAPLDASVFVSPEIGRWSSTVLVRCVEARPPSAWTVALGIRHLEETLNSFYSNVLCLQPLETAYKEVVTYGQTTYAERSRPGGHQTETQAAVTPSLPVAEPRPAAELPWLCAAAGALQRYAHTYLAETQREECAALFAKLLVCHVDQISLCVEVELSPSYLLLASYYVLLTTDY